MSFDYQGAKQAGYSDDEIMGFFSQQNPNFDFQGAVQAGYSPDEIFSFVGKQQPKEESSMVNKAGRILTQYGLGAAESALLPYEIATAPLASKEAQTMAYRGQLMDELDQLAEMKGWGMLSPEQEERLKEVEEQIKDYSKSEQYVKTADIGVRGLAEKLTGLDLKPKGFFENLANLTGFVKDPKKLANLKNAGMNVPEILKSVAPNSKELLRGAGMAAGLKAAEEGEFGPIGTMEALVVGDLAGHGVDAFKEILKDPKKFLAKSAAKMTPAESKNLQKEIIESFREQGIQADLGTITDSNLIRQMQSKLASSGLTGKALDDFKNQLLQEVRESYQGLAKNLGEAKYATSFEAGQVAKSAIEDIRKKELGTIREYYKGAENALREGAVAGADKVKTTLDKIDKALTPGALKSAEQQKVLNILDPIRKDIKEFAKTGKYYADVKSLMNTKAALNDMINYEVQGGQKQLLKELVGDIDRAIVSHGKENQKFAQQYILANQKFSKHAKEFRNKDMARMLMEQDPAKVLNRMNSVAGIKNLEKVLGKSPEGRKIFDDLKRFKLDQLVENSMINNMEKQVQLGRFSNVAAKGKDREILKEILGKRNFARFEKLQKNAGLLNESAQKFLNTSKTASYAVDVAAMGKFLKDIGYALSGNPWPIMKDAGMFFGVKGLTQYFADPQFLRAVEDVILSTKGKNVDKFVNSVMKLRPYLEQVSNQERSKQQ